MKVTYEADSGQIVCTRTNEKEWFAAEDQGGISIALRDANEGYLSDGDVAYQTERCLLKPELSVTDNEIRFQLTQKLVDRLERRTYQMEFARNGEVLPVRARVTFDKLKKGLIIAGGSIGVAAAVKSRSKAEPISELQPLATPPVSTPAPVSEPASVPLPSAESVTQPKVPEVSTVVDSARGKNRMPMVLAGILAAVLLLALLAYYLLTSTGSQPIDEEKVIPAQESTIKEETSVPLSAEKTEEKVSVAPVLSTREAVRQFFGTAERTPDAAEALAGTLKAETAEDQDALFRLWYYAVEAGSLKSLVSYARALDPTQPVWGTIKKDAAEAYRCYEKAGDHAAMNALKVWAQKAADGGDRAAKRFLDSVK